MGIETKMADCPMNCFLFFFCVELFLYLSPEGMAGIVLSGSIITRYEEHLFSFR